MADAPRFGEAARKDKPGSKDLEEEVDRKQDAVAQMEKERGVLPENKERMQKFRLGVPKESDEALFSALDGLGGCDFGDGEGGARGRVRLDKSSWNGERSKPESGG